MTKTTLVPKTITNNCDVLLLNLMMSSNPEGMLICQFVIRWNKVERAQFNLDWNYRNRQTILSDSQAAIKALNYNTHLRATNLGQTRGEKYSQSFDRTLSFAPPSTQSLLWERRRDGGKRSVVMWGSVSLPLPNTGLSKVRIGFLFEETIKEPWGSSCAGCLYWEMEHWSKITSCSRSPNCCEPCAGGSPYGLGIRVIIDYLRVDSC